MAAGLGGWWHSTCLCTKASGHSTQVVFLRKKFIFTVLISLAKIAVLSPKTATRHCSATMCQRRTSTTQPPAFPPSPSSLQRFPAAALPSSGPQTPPPPAFKPLRLLPPSLLRHCAGRTTVRRTAGVGACHGTTPRPHPPFSALLPPRHHRLDRIRPRLVRLSRHCGVGAILPLKKACYIQK